MKAQLFLFYLRFRKPIIILSAVFATVIVGLDNWLKYKDRNADHTPWRVTSVESGSSLTVSRHGETKNIKLCGVAAVGDESREFLASVMNLGDGTVELEKVGESYEAWVMLKPDYDVELVKHISNKPNELVEQQIHLNTWMVERGIARRDPQDEGQCREPEHLAWAEELALKDQLGIWQRQ
jgi:endonuclease YncB( thermonuclease family)